MSARDSKRVVEQIWEQLVNRGRLDLIGELVSRDFVDHAPLPGLAPGLEGLQQRIQLLHAAFPDVHSTIDKLVAEGDCVAAVVTTSGTHRGDFLGIPATGKRWTISEMHLLRVVGGQLVEHWGVADLLGLLGQLGVLPPGRSGERHGPTATGAGGSIATAISCDSATATEASSIAR